MKSSKRSIINFIILSIAFCFLFFSSIGTTDASFMDLEQSIKELQLLMEKVSPGVVMVIVYDNTGEEIARGSGFFIDREGRIITNALIMENAYSAEVLSESHYYDDVVVLNRDKNLDLALIQVKAIDETPLELDFEYRIEPGERVVVIGRSSGLAKTVSEGLVKSVSNRDTLELIQIQTTEPITSLRPSRDGPVLNRAGKVIGMTSTIISDETDFLNGLPMIPDYQNFNAVSVRSIKPFILEAETPEHLHPPKSRILLPWLKRKAINGFIILYQFGLSKLMAYVFAIVVFISLIQWFYIKLRNK
jgi:S1-C subfamily serine protease